MDPRLLLHFSPGTVLARLVLLVGLLTVSVDLPGAEGRADVVLADFEGDSFAGWQSNQVAFGKGPARPGRGAAMTATGFLGGGLASSAAFPEKDGALRGSLESREFVIGHDYLNFLIGGGNHPFRCAVSLWVGGRVVRTSSGNGSDRLEWATWDLRALRGQVAWIGIYDQAIEDERAYILVDEVTLSDVPKTAPGGEVDQAIVQVRREAVEAIRRNAARAAADPQRPVYHYAPPAQRMNDPNGPAWEAGYHHVFYQHMVFEGAGPAVDVHWGHARSRDLVNWETLPLAIHPAYERGELSCFSGNLARDRHGDPVQFVTSVPYVRGAFRHIWPARPRDAEWIHWERTPEKPPAGLVPHGAPDRNLKDAFPFAVGERRFLVLTDRDMPLYEALDERLTRWDYRGTLDGQSAECPNFFEVDGHWIYLSSPNAPVRYVVGEFDAARGRFTPRTEGRLNHDMGYYASTAYRDDQGRTILLGVSRGQKNSKAWTGVLALPRVLTIAADGHPRMRPVPELATLRRGAFRVAAPLGLPNRGHVVAGLKGDTMEIVARFHAGTASAFGLKVRRSEDGGRSLPILWRDGRIVAVKDTPKFPCAYALDAGAREITFHVFLDKGMLDVCTGDGRVFETRIHESPLADLGVEVFAEGGEATLLSLDAWQLAPARIEHDRLFTGR